MKTNRKTVESMSKKLSRAAKPKIVHFRNSLPYFAKNFPRVSISISEVVPKNWPWATPRNGPQSYALATPSGQSVIRAFGWV